MFAKVKKGAISTAFGEAKKSVVSHAKKISTEVKKEINKAKKTDTPTEETTKSRPETKSERRTESRLDQNADNAESGKGAETTTTNGVVDKEWCQKLLEYVNQHRKKDNNEAITWNDACYEQALLVAKDNSQTGENGYGVKEKIKAELKKTVANFRGTFKVTTQTMNLTNGGTTDEALQNFINSSGHWGHLMNPEAELGAFAAVQNGDSVYWMGVLCKLHPSA